MVVFSEFANQLRCQYCGKINQAEDWPAQGDMVPFYCQKEPGKFYVSVRCPECAKEWYVVWDDDPGPGCQSGAKAPADDFTLPVEGGTQPPETPEIETAVEAAPGPLETLDQAPEQKPEDDFSLRTEEPGETQETLEEFEEPEKEGFLTRLSRANPHTVLLGVSVAAILIAILFLFLELMNYDFDIKARQGKEGAQLVPSVQRLSEKCVV